MAKVAFLGLGVMGYPMAGLLAAAGHQVQVYNRTASRAQSWQRQYGHQVYATPRAAAEAVDVVFCCVGNDEDLRQVTLGEEGAFAAMAAGSIFVDHTTTSASVARELAEQARANGFSFLDAPVSGGQAGAENGTLAIMVGGEQSDLLKVRPLLDCYAGAVTLLGPVGSGQLCKMVNQVCLAGVIQGLAEGLHFATAAGLDAEQVVEVISKGAAQSWQMDYRHKTMLQGQYDHGFAVDWMRKDLAIALDEARRNGALLPITALVDQFYNEVQAQGGGRWDTSSLLARLSNLRSFK